MRVYKGVRLLTGKAPRKTPPERRKVDRQEREERRWRALNGPVTTRQKDPGDT